MPSLTSKNFTLFSCSGWFTLTLILSDSYHAILFVFLWPPPLFCWRRMSSVSVVTERNSEAFVFLPGFHLYSMRSCCWAVQGWQYPRYNPHGRQSVQLSEAFTLRTTEFAKERTDSPPFSRLDCRYAHPKGTNEFCLSCNWAKFWSFCISSWVSFIFDAFMLLGGTGLTIPSV